MKDLKPFIGIMIAIIISAYLWLIIVLTAKLIMSM